MKEQRKTLKELLNENGIGAISTFILDQIRNAHPGYHPDYEFKPELGKISVRYFTNEPCRDLCLMIDSSGSIDCELFKAIGEGSREAFKAGLGDGQRRDYAAVNFSDKTLFSGWVPKTHLEKLESVIDVYQQGGTHLDPKTIMQLSQRDERFATLMITDGMMQNPNEVIPVLQEMTRRGNIMGVIYVGRDGVPKMFEEMKDFADVFHIKDKNEIIAAMKDYAQTALK